MTRFQIVSKYGFIHGNVVHISYNRYKGHRISEFWGPDRIPLALFIHDKIVKVGP